MKKGRSKLKWAVAFAAVTLILICAVAALGIQTDLHTPAGEKRADIVEIDSMREFGTLERPAVLFLHDKHTEALAKRGQDCSVCHLTKDDKRSLKFKRIQDPPKQELMELYHDQCIGCHQETKASGMKSGPEVCAECHREDPDLVSIREPIGFTLSLHYRHSKSQDKKCEKCHHAYNEKTKKLYYDKGNEGTCRYCHGEVKVENRISFRKAAHLDCISCHQKTMARNQSAGPVECSGCHNPEEQAMIEVVKDVPRIKRNQPDQVFIRKLPPASEQTTEEPQQRANPVPFNHLAHEQNNDTCRVCHHAAISTCNSCHSLEGKKEGEFVRLEQAMHQLETAKSCRGCHTLQQLQPRCAGCHGAMEKQRQPEQTLCAACHVKLPEDAPDPNSEAGKTLAAELLASRDTRQQTYALSEIPETVEIKKLSRLYEGAKMPHRRIVQTLVRNIADDKLAAGFHSDPGTLCQGCHHHNPPTKTPPKCASCHGMPFDDHNMLRPGLMAAYHNQCLQCHTRMGIAKPAATDCTGCHKKKM